MTSDLPIMQCDKDCGDCCTMAWASDKEYARIERYAAEHDIKPLRQGLRCPWYQQGQCAVYPVRPLICRLFGHSESLVCPRGYNVNIPRKVEAAMMRKYQRKQPGTRFLHEVCYGLVETMKLLDSRTFGIDAMTKYAEASDA